MRNLWKLTLCLAVAALAATAPAFAQTAPAGWKTQTRDNGATTFTPPDLAAGEKYSVTVYDAAPLGGKSLEAWLRGFAGNVGTKPEQLAAPLDVKTSQNDFARGIGAYVGPKGAALLVVFDVFSTDGQSVCVQRVLFSDPALMERYAARQKELFGAMVRRAVSPTGKDAPTPGEKPYPWTVAPGKGLRPAQIAALIYCTDYGSVSGIPIEQVVLLLRDGTAFKDLPCAPDQLDVTRSRANDAARWGLWKPQGDQYLVSWAGAPFEKLPSLGLGFPMTPGAPGTRLSGRYGAARSASFGGDWQMSWGVTFDASGRFTRDRQGGSNFSVGGGDSATDVTTTYNQNGSSATASGSGVAATAGQKSQPNGDLTGTYSVDGFNLTLRYDNGQVAHLPFFFLSPQHEGIWFDGSLVMRAK